MGKLTVEKTDIEGVLIITPEVREDARGYFMETYQKKDFEAVGVNVEFVQDNQSASRKGVLRGLHFRSSSLRTSLFVLLKALYMMCA